MKFSEWSEGWASLKNLQTEISLHCKQYCPVGLGHRRLMATFEAVVCGTTELGIITTSNVSKNTSTSSLPSASPFLPLPSSFTESGVFWKPTAGQLEPALWGPQLAVLHLGRSGPQQGAAQHAGRKASWYVYPWVLCRFWDDWIKDEKKWH